jgi:hypothetical protein
LDAFARGDCAAAAERMDLRELALSSAPKTLGDVSPGLSASFSRHALPQICDPGGAIRRVLAGAEVQDATLTGPRDGVVVARAPGEGSLVRFVVGYRAGRWVVMRVF